MVEIAAWAAARTIWDKGRCELQPKWTAKAGRNCSPSGQTAGKGADKVAKTYLSHDRGR